MQNVTLASLALLLVLTGAGCTNVALNSYSSDDSSYEADSYSVPDELEASVEAPLRASLGESFQVVATVVNGSDEPQLLHSIDVDAEYLEGVAVVSTDPAFSETFLLDDGTITHFFETPVAPGATATVTFNMEAVAAGDFKGDFDVCFDDGLSCNYLQVRTIIE